MLQNIMRGVWWGILFAAGFAVLAIAIQVLAGSDAGWTGPPPFPIVIASYFVAGIIVGAVVGLLLPIAQNWLGAALVGLVGGLALATTIVLIEVGSFALGTPELNKILVLGLLWGPGGGILLYFLFKIPL